tara:strand:+ start:1039 stop:2019 length:981 start_codon:yes stop_codon:yes gene_type:complete
MNRIENILFDNLKNFNLLDKKLLVGFSGGPDSTALILALNELANEKNDLYFEAFHVNYGLRKESYKDQEFVEKICNDLNIKLAIKEIDFKIKSKSEDNLRNIRYKLMSSHILDNGLYCLLTGHNLNDHVETFLMKLSRGTGLKGMEGLKYLSTLSEYNNLKILRPFIDIKKIELFDYCISNKVTPINDISNKDNKYSRNRIRNRIIPELEKLNPELLNTINRLTKIINEQNMYQNKLINKKFEKIKVIEKFNEISFNRKEFNELEEIEKKLILKSKCESLSKLVFIEKKHLDIIVEKCLSKNNNFSLDMPGPVTIKVNREQITLKL